MAAERERELIKTRLYPCLGLRSVYSSQSSILILMVLDVLDMTAFIQLTSDFRVSRVDCMRFISFGYNFIW